MTCRALESYPEPMFAMVLHEPGGPLEALDLPVPPPAGGEIRVKVHVCGVCRTDLHILDGELGDPKLPLVMGHQIVGTVDQMGADVFRFRVGQRVGVPWLGKTCQTCSFCAGLIGYRSLGMCEDPNRELKNLGCTASDPQYIS